MTTSTCASDSFSERPGQGLALVDYDNMCRYTNHSKLDVELHTVDLVDTLVHAFRETYPDLNELDVRFYGGWTDELGLPSIIAFWLSQILPMLRGRRHGLMVRPSLATTMVQFPDVVLRGTVRIQTRRKRQKMVDGMLGCDAMFVAATDSVRIGIVTDDDDLVPATLSANAANMGLMAWMRPRPMGEGLNDQVLSGQGLRIHHIRENSHD